MSTLTPEGRGYLAGLADAQALANEVLAGLAQEGASLEVQNAVALVSSVILMERKLVEKSAEQ